MLKLTTRVRLAILFACSALVIPGCARKGIVTAGLQSVIDSLSSRFVPDNRMGIATIKAVTVGGNTVILKGETTDPLLGGEIIKALDKGNIKLIDSVIILPDTIHNKLYTGLVTLSVANIRKLPDHAAEMVSQSVLGTPVRILKREGSWLLIRTPDDYIGWAEDASIAAMTASGINSWKKSDRVITTVGSGWIYESPGKTGVVGDFVAGCIFVRVGDAPPFTKVGLPDGREGYISTGDIESFDYWRKNASCTGETILKSAAAFNGLPYLWGGTSSKGVDCSGFSQSVFYLNGIILRRDASLQALHGTDVDISDGYGRLEPGDLLFFGIRKGSKLRVTHVAIYKGDGEYYNSSGRVIVDGLIHRAAVSTL